MHKGEGEPLSIGDLRVVLADHTAPQIYRRIQIPVVGRKLREFLGITELPTTDRPRRPGEVNILESENNTIVGFNSERFPDRHYGVAVSPVAKDGNSQQTRGVFSMNEETGLPTVTMPEGLFTIFLFAPPPYYDHENDQIIHFDAHITCFATVNENGYYGTMGSFNKDAHQGLLGKKMNPIQWMILDQWSQIGAPQHGVREFPGIRLPAPAGSRTKLLQFTAFSPEKEAELGPHVFTGSGIFCVDYIANRMPGSVDKFKEYIEELRKKIANPVSISSNDAPSAMNIGLTATDTTGLSSGTGFGEYIPYGPTVVFEVKGATAASGQAQTFTFESGATGIIQKRDPKDKNLPDWRALARWGMPNAEKIIKYLLTGQG